MIMNSLLNCNLLAMQYCVGYVCLEHLVHRKSYDERNTTTDY